eukprot:TRINITY_DN37671_c0_g1_i1.p1 TRINITY_DN37671_c0_g1~~TRINITY_DN37671_c0_g1_i1.p1  ORF type:complete len:154 (+),score=30.02 TRINITY_DN37671_c0_g1_i1:70-531(+)
MDLLQEYAEEEEEDKRYTYCAVVLDAESVEKVNEIRPGGAAEGYHMTLKYWGHAKGRGSKFIEGTQVTMHGTHLITVPDKSFTVLAVSTAIDLHDSRVPHITLATGGGWKPAIANEILKNVSKCGGYTTVKGSHYAVERTDVDLELTGVVKLF